MSNGLEATEVRLNKVITSAITFRLDSDYYRKQYLSDESVIANSPERFSTLHSLGLEVDGSAFYPALEPFYGSGNFPFIRVADVKGFVDFDNCEHISKEILPHFPTLKVVQLGDIVLTKGGSIARAGLITQEAAASRDLIFINSSKLNESQYTYLSLYFQTDFCKRLLVRSSSMSVQPHLTLTLVKDVAIFKTTETFQDGLLQLIIGGRQHLERSKSSYAEAENLLLKELGLDHWQPPADLSYGSKMSEAFAVSRLDSEFFHPKYAWLTKTLADKFPKERVGAWGKVLKGMSVEYAEGDEGTPTIRSGDLVDIDDGGKFLKASPNQKMFLLERGDVLISSIGFGSIGKVQVFDKVGAFATVSEVTVIRQSRVNPYYLFFFLRSPAGQLQINRYITGATGQLHLYPKDVERISVPIIHSNLEARLESLFKQSRAMKKHAHLMLDIAKRGVEIAIEQDEAAARAWMDEQTRQLDAL